MTRTTLGCLMLIIGVAVEAAAEPPSRPWAHTRPLTASAARLVAEAGARSPTVIAMLEALEQSDVVVYVVDSILDADGPRAYLQFVTFAAGTRYLAIHLDRWRVMPIESQAWLAHELQHALEIAGAAEVRDSTSLARLYRRIGWESGTRKFETDLARAAGRRARDELLGLVSQR